MNRFQVALTEHAIADLKDIPEELRNQVHQDLNSLESAPFPLEKRIKRLRGFRPPVYRLRSGDFRVLYHIEGEIITVLRVIDRELLERVIRRLRI